MECLWVKEPQGDYDVIDNKHDKGYKYLLSAKKVFVELLKSFVKQGWVEKIDESKVARVDKSFVLQDFKDKEADLVYWVKLNDQDVIFYILMEMQSKVDFQMPYRLLLYMVEIWRGILKDVNGRAEEKKEFRLPAVIPIILYNGRNNWTACRSFKEYLSGYELFGGNIIDFEYILIDVNRYTEEELMKMSNLISSVFLIDQKQDIESMFERLKKVVDTLGGMDPQQFELFRNWFANVVMRDMEEESYRKFEKIIHESRECTSMVYNVELLLKEEFQKSRKQGRAEGEKEKALAIAENLLFAGVDAEIIVKTTGISEEDLREIKNKMG